MASPFFPDVARGAEDVLAEAGYWYDSSFFGFAQHDRYGTISAPIDPDAAVVEVTDAGPCRRADVLEPATILGALPLALHPVMTFTGSAVDLERLGGAMFGVTAPEPLWPIAAALVVEMGAEPIRIAERDRTLYHAALAHGANHLVTLVNDAMDLLRHAGVAEPDRTLAPLLSAALDNVLRQGDAALTGPVARGDASTVEEHVAAIEGIAPETVAAYVALARRTATRALASGRLRAADAEPLLDSLGGRPSQDWNGSR